MRREHRHAEWRGEGVPSTRGENKGSMGKKMNRNTFAKRHTLSGEGGGGEGAKLGRGRGKKGLNKREEATPRGDFVDRIPTSRRKPARLTVCTKRGKRVPEMTQ